MSLRHFCIFLLIFHIFSAGLLSPLSLEAATRAEQSQDDPPTFFEVYSSSGIEKFQANCSEKSMEAVSCLFVGTRINPPTGEATSDFGRLSDKDIKEAQEAFKKMSQSKDNQELVQKFEERLRDKSLGPKTSEWLKSMMLAHKTGDFAEITRLIDEHERRTCKASVQAFRLTFRKIGPGRWLATPGSDGLCQIVKIYELNQSGNKYLWEMIETRVAAGRTEGSCKGVEEELKKPTVWSWKNPHEGELSCDFMEYATFVLID